ncbi:MAG: SPOR domain-containing protein [Gemmatimonadales bacterium]
MTGLQLVADDLDRQIPGLLASSTVVALVPATDLRGWAAEMAWRIARAAAAGGRRTVLVDCFVDSPTLHGAREAPDEEGLVDAFEYGASLNRIVQQQPQADLFFIPAGTYAPDAEPVLQNPRWRRLSAGFRHEDALLLLYVGAEHLATIPADPDGIVVLAPQGQDLAVADAPALAGAVAEGLPLLAVVADDQTAGRATAASEAPEQQHAEGEAKPAGGRGSGPAPVSAQEARHARVGLIVATLFIIVLGAGTAVRFGALDVLRRGTDTTGTRPEGRARLQTRPEGQGASAPAVAERGLQSGTPLPFVLEVAVLPRLVEAFAMADSLEAHGAPAMIAPGSVQGRGVFYRVHAGPFATRARADSARASLALGGLLPRGGGTVLSVPLSVALDGPLRFGAAASERARLRRAGVPSFVLGQADGTYRVYIGAFARAVSGTLLHDLFTPTGGAGELVTRAGNVP